jgi:AraC-like DNA-binding protein
MATRAERLMPADIEDSPRAVVGLAGEYAGGDRIPPHRHRRAQLVYATAGVMAVTTEKGAWVVPPQRAVWVPALTGHSIRMHGGVSMRALYIAPSAARRLPRDCCVVTVSSLLRELILEVIAFTALDPPNVAEARIMAVVLDRIRAARVTPLYLPAPADPRLRAVTEALAGNPGDGRGLDEWAKSAGASGRTLARLFLRETGMTFRQWRQQARLLAALTRLAAGQPVTTVALDLGYDSPSAFIAMFRRALGETPGRFFGPKGE